MARYDFSAAQEFARSGRWIPIPDRKTMLFCAERGPADRDSSPTLLFLHGIPTWSFLWRGVLAETGLEYRSIAIDLPGFGLSDKSPRHSFEIGELAKTVEEFIERVIDPETPVVLVVHDFGALVGAALIVRNPERYQALIIANTSFREESWSGGGPLRLLGVPLIGEVAMLLAKPWMLRLAMYPFVSDVAARSPRRVAGYWYPFEGGFGYSLLRLFRERPVRADDIARMRLAIREFAGPSLLLWGANDPAFTTRDFDKLQKLLSAPRSLRFRNANHFLPEERPRAVGRQIRAFVRNASG